ncbi:MAG: hypothetical protein JWN34_3909, partial [Bryobacterales bacterium]|nr:hypothetical protein [Bryobacterales bacterium]
PHSLLVPADRRGKQLKLSRLTTEGIAAMHQWLDTSAPEGADVPADLLTESRFVEVLESERIAEVRTFDTRHAWGQYAVGLLDERPVVEVAADAGLWCWLTLFYFTQVCPKGAGGKRKLGQRARYVPTGTDFRTYYRHLLTGPWRIMVAHVDDPSRPSGVLAGALSVPGELYEQIASRMELATSPTVLPLVNRLYIDPATGLRRRGAGGASRGSPRRLADILMQFDVTFDIYAMPVNVLLDLLPNEFDRYRRAPVS